MGSDQPRSHHHRPSVPRGADHERSAQHTALDLIIVVLAVGGVVSFLVDAWLSPVLLVAAGAIALTPRSALSQALRVPDTDRRHRRFRTAAFLGATFVISYVVFVLTVGDSWAVTDTLLSLVGSLALLGAGGFLVAGLATPRTPDRGQLAGTR